MNLLLDTHIFLWWVSGDRKLPRRLRTAIADSQNDIWVSAISALEIATKFRLGKLPEAAIVANDVSQIVTSQGFRELAVSLAHAQRAGALPWGHTDPFDRVLFSQALLDDFWLVSVDRAFIGAPIKLLS